MGNQKLVTYLVRREPEYVTVNTGNRRFNGSFENKQEKGVGVASDPQLGSQRTATPTAQGFAGLLRMATKTAI